MARRTADKSGKRSSGRGTQAAGKKLVTLAQVYRLGRRDPKFFARLAENAAAALKGRGLVLSAADARTLQRLLSRPVTIKMSTRSLLKLAGGLGYRGPWPLKSWPTTRSLSVAKIWKSSV